MVWGYSYSRGVGLFLQPCSLVGTEQGFRHGPARGNATGWGGAGWPCMAELQKNGGSALVAAAG